MTPERRKFTILSSVNLCVMLACGFLRYYTHHSAFTLGFYVCLLLSSWMTYRFASKHRQPDTLTHLFPESPASAKERP